MVEASITVLFCFDKTFALHSEHRWLSVLLTIMWLLPLREVLQEVWNARLFGHYDSKQGDLNVDAITAQFSMSGFGVTSLWSIQFRVCWQNSHSGLKIVHAIASIVEIVHHSNPDIEWVNWRFCLRSW